MNQLYATYRFQFHKDFTFSDFEKILPYLQRLGVGTVYASPVFEAVPGSTHGYDGLNPHNINPEIGTLEQLRNISGQLKKEGIRWLQDIVPNHMAYDPRNPWLLDVLEKGPQSVYAPFFDVAWTSPLFKGRIMVPFLGATLDEVLQNGELTIAWEDQRFVFKYYDTAWPLQPLSYATVLTAGDRKRPEALEQLLSQLPKTEDPQAYAQAWNETRQQLEGLQKNETVNAFVTSCLETVNADKEILRQIEAQQSYRLCHWQETDSRINYRRFFTVNGLICLNIQDPAVFDQYHRLVRELVEEGLFQGLRIDHIDGLYDPTGYLQRLREMAGEDVPIVVEKILEPGESLPAEWPIEGNTGYDFLSLVNNLFTLKESEPAFTRFYRNLVKDKRSIHQQLHDKKAHILHQHMAGELDNLFQLFLELNLVEKRVFASIRREELKEAIGEFLIQCPVYRYYGRSFPLPDEEAAAIGDILNRVRRSNHDIRRSVDILEDILIKKPAEGNEDMNARITRFYQRCMQFTGPLMAKGVEDTLMYTYQRFIGHNEVGDSPEAFGMSVEEFHAAMTERQQRWPHSLNGTSTHDTKRGEDVRARLNVLTDLSEEWLQTVTEWRETNASLKKENAPDANDEYFIYQTLVGAHPFPGEDPDNFPARMEAYLEKALREGKLRSDWARPDEAYETAAKAFSTALLDNKKPFRKGFEAWLKRIADHGIVNSLSQVALKFTCPGIPDVYQGCELWDLSLVDPDNRRPVDYAKRSAWLEELEEHPAAESLWNDRYSGRIKLWLTHSLFRLRRQFPDLFTSGEYLPLEVEGAYRNHVIAYARRYRQQLLVVVLPLHTALLSKEQGKDIREIDWKDTAVLLPEGVGAEWEHLVEGTTDTHTRAFPVQHLFRSLPLALLRGRKVRNERGAGLLMHISSLPSAYGIGDLGPEAYQFADFLARSRQKYWQLLPLNPTEEGQGHSPYSSISSRAGNVLFISPDLLVDDGLLQASDLRHAALPAEGRVNYPEAERVKSALFEKAWKAFRDGSASFLQKDFQAFRQKEKEWLDDFALYALLKERNGGKPWYEWEEDLKLRKPASLERIAAEGEETLDKIKWLQFLFARQWQALRSYCNDRDIRLIGDLPFYVSYDSADVWAHRHLFALDEEGARTGLAGVPPDSFSADGQLWGMPVFNWEALKEEGYAWWIARLRKNIELFDIVRLDHFRAFAAYWEVPAGESTARNGTWKEGPGAPFFTAVKEQLGELPFVAEDLGEIDAPVYQLRDAFGLPGMKVLQFAFGGDMPRSVHIPHNHEPNFLVYTGTHDNNTTRGWFSRDADDTTRAHLEAYVGRPVSAAEVHIVFARMAYGSVASIAILPLQDVLNLDERARMNTPASGQDNWAWRLLPGQLTGIAQGNLRKWTRMYNRE